MTHSFSIIMSNFMAKNKKDSGVFKIPCTIWTYKFYKALCDLRVSIDLMPYAIYQRLGFGASTSTTIILIMVEHSVKKMVGVLSNVLVKAYRFIVSMDFIVIDCEIDDEIPIIIENPFFEI